MGVKTPSCRSLQPFRTRTRAATAALVEALSALVTQKTFPKFILAMVQGSPKVVAGVKQALAASRGYPPHLLLDALNKEDNPRSALLDVVMAQKSRFGVRELLNAAANQAPNEKAALFRIIGDNADASSVSELIGRLQGKDQVRASISSIFWASSMCPKCARR